VTANRAPDDVVRRTLSVRRPEERCEIVVGRGALDRLPDLIASLAPAPRYVVVSDSNVAPLHGRRVVELLEGAGRRVDLLPFPAGEANKTPGTWVSLVEALGQLELGRDGCVVSVGGGVTGDLAGFVAASFARGVSFVQVPTSLLAMVDASIGGKTGVDLAAGKNLVGAFHHPRLVLIDPDTLRSLPAGTLAEGLAEAVKHGAIADADYLDWIGSAAPALLAGDGADAEHLVRGSVAIKTAIVERDSVEAGERAMLNFGHTIAHAVEQCTAYAVRHGHAVAGGLVVEAAIGEAIGVTAPGTASRIRAVLASCALPTGLPAGLDADRLLDAARSDKKARDGSIRYALLGEAGMPAPGPDAWTHAVPDEIVRQVLGRFLSTSTGWV
jgi:3-dehydroquinate synthase